MVGNIPALKSPITMLPAWLVAPTLWAVMSSFILILPDVLFNARLPVPKLITPFAFTLISLAALSVTSPLLVVML